jgi:hypothetical protein
MLEIGPSPQLEDPLYWWILLSFRLSQSKLWMHEAFEYGYDFPLVSFWFRVFV